MRVYISGKLFAFQAKDKSSILFTRLKKMYQLKITAPSENAALVAKKILVCLFEPIHKIIPLPSKKRKFTLLKSPHVNNSSKEHFKVLKFQYILYTSVSLNFIKIGLSKLSPNIQVTLKKIS